MHQLRTLKIFFFSLQKTRTQWEIHQQLLQLAEHTSRPACEVRAVRMPVLQLRERQLEQLEQFHSCYKHSLRNYSLDLNRSPNGPQNALASFHSFAFPESGNKILYCFFGKERIPKRPTCRWIQSSCTYHFWSLKTWVYTPSKQHPSFRTNRLTWAHVPDFYSILLLSLCLIAFSTFKYFLKLQMGKKKNHSLKKLEMAFLSIASWDDRSDVQKNNPI